MTLIESEETDMARNEQRLYREATRRERTDLRRQARRAKHAAQRNALPEWVVNAIAECEAPALPEWVREAKALGL